MIITALTRDLYRQLEGEYPNLTIKGIAVINGEEVIGLLGITVVDGRNFIVCSVGNIKKREIIQAWRYFKDKFLVPNACYYSILDDEKLTAKSFNEHFGFMHMADNIYMMRC